MGLGFCSVTTHVALVPARVVELEVLVVAEVVAVLGVVVVVVADAVDVLVFDDIAFEIVLAAGVAAPDTGLAIAPLAVFDIALGWFVGFDAL